MAPRDRQGQNPEAFSPQLIQLLQRVQNGLPLVEQPYAALGREVGLSEQEVIASLRSLLRQGVIKRLGVVVRHHELGYRCNAMVVWDVPDTEVAEVGQSFADFPYVTLCYQRPRRLPEWPYNLFTMIHGRNRAEVEYHLCHLSGIYGERIPYQPLYSKRRFKQRGARYFFSGSRSENDVRDNSPQSA